MVQPGMSEPWVEKYRPRKVEDVAHQEEVVTALQKSLQTNNLPHLLFYGPPGTGKTTSALAICRQLYGSMMKERVLELNASDERGINVVREKIKNFAAISVSKDTVHGHPCPPFKVIILDEADSMTQDAQNALRRTMESYSKITRFCFICNYITRIIEPIASRCAKFRFKPLHAEVMESRIRHICGLEGVTMDGDAMETLAKVAGGDMRKAITSLQSAVRLRGTTVHAATILDVAGQVPDDAVQQLLQAATKSNFNTLHAAVIELMAQGYAAHQLLHQLQEHIMSSSDFSDANKAHMCIALAAADKCLVDGADEQLQLLTTCSAMHRAMHGIPVPVAP